MLRKATLFHSPSPHSGSNKGIPIASCTKLDIALLTALLITCPALFLSCNGTEEQEYSQPPDNITG